MSCAGVLTARCNGRTKLPVVGCQALPPLFKTLVANNQNALLYCPRRVFHHGCR